MVTTNSPGKTARELLSSIGWTDPGDFSLEEIAWSSGVIVKTAGMEDSQGRIIMSNGLTIITINESITYGPRKNFVIAHENTG